MTEQPCMFVPFAYFRMDILQALEFACSPSLALNHHLEHSTKLVEHLPMLASCWPWYLVIKVNEIEVEFQWPWSNLSMTFFQAKNNQYQKSLSLMFLHIVPTNEEMFVNPNNKYQILFTYMECKRNMSKELRIESKHFEESFN